MIGTRTHDLPHANHYTTEITYQWFVTRLTRRVLLWEQELLTLPEQLSSLPVFSGFRVTLSLVLWVCFVDRCLSFWPLCYLFFDWRILITSLWYLQALPTTRLLPLYSLFPDIIKHVTSRRSGIRWHSIYINYL